MNESIGIITGLVAAIAGLGALIGPLIKVVNSYVVSRKTLEITLSSTGDKKTIHIEADRFTEQQLQEIVNFLKGAENGEKTTSEEK